MKKVYWLAAAVLLPSIAGAQIQERKWDVGTHLGLMSFDKGTGIDDAPFLGVDGTYHGLLKKWTGPLDLGIGFTFSAARPSTLGDQFPVIQLDFGDTTFLYTVAQTITLLQFGGQAVLGMDVGRFRVYTNGGTGGYSITTNPRQTTENETFVHEYWNLGLGLNYALRETVGIRLQGQSVWFTGFDRDRLDATVGYAKDRRVRDALPAPHPEPSRGLAQNWAFSLVFSYIPSRVGGNDGPRGGEER